ELASAHQRLSAAKGRRVESQLEKVWTSRLDFHRDGLLRGERQILSSHLRLDGPLLSIRSERGQNLGALRRVLTGRANWSTGETPVPPLCLRPRRQTWRLRKSVVM